jgi:hypothetical protein
MTTQARPQHTPEELQRRIETDPDFIGLRRFDYSLEKALKKHPEGLPENLVAQALGKSVSWVAGQYRLIVERLRDTLQEE